VMRKQRASGGSQIDASHSMRSGSNEPNLTGNYERSLSRTCAVASRNNEYVCTVALLACPLVEVSDQGRWAEAELFAQADGLEGTGLDGVVEPALLDLQQGAYVVGGEQVEVPVRALRRNEAPDVVVPAGRGVEGFGFAAHRAGQ
jgi:hypothetical protein